MNILLNGQSFEVPGEITLAELVRLRRIETSAYAVERNREVVARRKLATTPIKENDRIEIVVAVGGG